MWKKLQKTGFVILVLFFIVAFVLAVYQIVSPAIQKDISQNLTINYDGTVSRKPIETSGEVAAVVVFRPCPPYLEGVQIMGWLNDLRSSYPGYLWYYRPGECIGIKRK